ncbi:MAG: choice-of-anchor Q domain-containing protein [Lysobacterales bacterium]
MNNSVLRVVTALTLGLTVWDAQAEVFCVNTSNGLQNALNSAASNTESDEIRIMFGEYNVPVSPVSGFRFVSSQAGNLAISGGWGPPSPFGGPNCQSRKYDPTITTLNGNFQIQGLVIQPGAVTGDILIENMTVAQGRSGGSGGGIRVNPFDPAWPGNLTIRTILFDRNADVTGGAGLFATVGVGDFRLDNSIFSGNQSRGQIGAAVVTANGQNAIIANNTVVANSALGDLSTGFSFGGDAATLLINNVFFENDLQFDLALGGNALSLQNNFYNSLNAADLLEETGSLSGDPGIGSGVFSVGPLPGSPLIDGGLMVIGGLPFRDAQGGLREMGPAVDIGAIEIQVFGDGVEGNDNWTVPTNAQ